MRVCYTPKKFSIASQVIITQANQIIESYREMGYSLTLRQLYYQFVSRDLLPNTTQSYNRLGGIISDARLAGEVDWEAIEDRTRSTKSNPHWHGPRDIVLACAQQFQIDKWSDQPYRPQVWIEKEALAGIVEQVCRPLDVSFLSCRGYTSQSEMWKSAQKMIEVAESGQVPVIIHLGDHDPSGIDMTRDISDRLNLFLGESDHSIEVDRIALNMDQIRAYKPPPNPAKTTDSRFASYVSLYGGRSWELDALPPEVLSKMITEAVLRFRDERKWGLKVKQEKAGRSRLLAISEEL